MRHYNVTLLSEGKICHHLHYEPYARDWWLPRPQQMIGTIVVTSLPYRLHMRTLCIINNMPFITTVIQQPDSLQLGYICMCESKSSGIATSASGAVNSIYHQLFNKNTEFSGPAIMGF